MINTRTINKIANMLKRRFTVGLLLTTIISLFLAIIVRLVIEGVVGTSPIRGGMEYIDLCFFVIVALIRLILSVIIEYITGESYNVSLFTLPHSFPIDSKGEYVEHNGLKQAVADKSALKMVEGSSSKESSSPSKNETNKMVGGSTTYSKTPTKMLTIDETLELKDEFRKNLDTQADMVKKLRNMKESKDLKYYLDKNGGLDLSAPSSVQDEELHNIAKKVGIMDRIINTKSAEYGKLEGKDLMSNNSDLSTAYSKYRNFIKEQYNGLFEKPSDKE